MRINKPVFSPGTTRTSMSEVRARTPVGRVLAGASCFVLGVSMCVSHSTLLPRCLSSRHEQQVNLLEIGLYMHGNFHLKGPTFGNRFLLSLMLLSQVLYSTQQGFSKLWNWLNKAQLDNKFMIQDTGSTQQGFPQPCRIVLSLLSRGKFPSVISLSVLSVWARYVSYRTYQFRADRNISK